MGASCNHNGRLEAANAHIDDDRYDMVECVAAGRLEVDLSEQLRGCSIASMTVRRLSSSDLLVGYFLQLQ